MRDKEKNAVLSGIIAAVSVFASGFCMMFALWNYLKFGDGLPGLFDYRAATIGDGICLPILVGSIVTFKKCNKPINEREEKRCLRIGVILAIIGIISQMSWLISDDTKLNWSIPIQNYFNVAGWYHSLFFIGMFGVIGYQLSSLWFVMRHHELKISWIEKIFLILFVASGTLFVLVFLADDYGKRISIPYLFSGAILVLLMLLLLFMWKAQKEGKGEYTIIIVTGLLGAYGYGLLMCTQGKGDVALALGGALCVCFLWRTEKFSVGQLIFMDLWMVVSCCGLFYAVSSLDNWIEVGVIVLTVWILTLVYEKIYLKELRSRNFSVLAVSLYIMISVLATPDLKYSFLIEWIFIGIVYLVVEKEISGYFENVKSAEKQKGQGKLSDKQFAAQKGKAYLQIIIGIIAVGVLLSHWLLDIAVANGSKILKGNIGIKLSWFIIEAFIMLCMAIIGMSKIRKQRSCKILTIALTVIMLAILFLNTLVNISNNYVPFGAVKWTMMIFSLFACIGAARMVKHGYSMNLVMLRGVPEKKDIRIMSYVLFGGDLCVALSTTALILVQTSWSALGVSIVNILLAFIIIPFLSALTMKYEQKISPVVPNSELGGVAQDGLMIALIIIFASYLPCTYIGVNTELILGIQTLEIPVILGVVTLLATAFKPVEFCLKQNVEHVKNQKEVLLNYPQEEERWNSLRECLKKQSKQTVFAMLPYVLLVIIGKFISGLLKSMTLKEIWQKLICTYIDGQMCIKKDK